ncbi:MAG: HEAT repeat domain-containing protein [Methanobacteriaceae archaeon]|nr:HEAT repeat domain-containing protein [Methanobacteriaceae archaeon]MDP3035282.1 HEAT repeat domain-containing protein [Methanobacteriaceae archaeon]MDP3623113.1 HEAT repeat domain-containing protein [Methanobacteriaceae archaeon]
MESELKSELKKDKILENSKIFKYASDDDSHIRKNIYLILSRLYLNDFDFQEKIIFTTKLLYQSPDEKQRQNAVFTWGEIGKFEFDTVAPFLDMALNDNIHKVKSAIMASLKKMGEKNPQPTLSFAKKFINHPDPEVKRLIVHGIDLRGRTHPEEILPLLYKLQNEVTPRVRNMIIHLIGQLVIKKDVWKKLF